jgi:hypothetical protein
VVESLEKHQRELEEKNRELQERNEQLSRAQKEMEAQIAEKVQLEGLLHEPLHRLDFMHESSVSILRGNVSKLSDYMVRAQQLITMLVGQDRLKPAVKEAMRRIDWDRVKTQFPQTVKESRDILDQTQKNNQPQQEQQHHV